MRHPDRLYIARLLKLGIFILISSFFLPLTVFSQIPAKPPKNLFQEVEMMYTEPDTFIRLKTQLPLRKSIEDRIFAVKDSMVYSEGDIILGHLSDLETSTNGARGVAINSNKWENATIPYEIGTGFNSQMIDRINQAIQIVNDNTNLCVIPRTSESEYILFTYYFGSCGSYIGNDPRYPEQPIFLYENCSLYSVVHELFHAAGMYHEQSRNDRDEYVLIHFENIATNYEHNFKKANAASTDDIGTYNYNSLMHYPTDAFSHNDQPTIETINPSNSPIGQRDSLTQGDIATINTLYPLRCDAVCEISSIAAGTQFPCDENAYDQELIITFESPPYGSKLVVNGELFNVTSSPQNILLADLPADGNPVDIQAYFSLFPECQLSLNGLFSAPQGCTPVCSITNITAGVQSACNPNTNAYTQQVTVWYSSPPPAGSLVINGQFFTITQSPQTETLQLIANGIATDITASFSEAPSCSITKSDLFIAPEPCNLIGCQPDLSVADITMDAGIYQIAQDIQSEATINSGVSVEYVAGNQISLLPGFQALPGAHFIARIDSCSTSPCGAENILFSKTYGGSQNDENGWSGFITTNDGGFAFAGPTRSNDFDVSTNAGLGDYWLVKLDQSGDILWEKSIGSANEEWCQALAQTTDNGYILAGYRCSGSVADCQLNADKDFWIVKTNATGTVIWEQVYGGSGIDAAFDVIQTSDGGYMVVGYSTTSDDLVFSENKGKYDIWALKLNSVGVISWKINLGGSENDTPFQVVEVAGGGYLILGDTRSNDQDISFHFGENDFWLVRLSATGSMVWEKTYGGNGIDRGRAIYPAADGGFWLAGESGSNNFDLPGTVPGNFGSSDVYLVKIDALGNLEWSQNYGGSKWDVAFSLLEDTAGDVIIAGNTDSEDYDVTCNNLEGTADGWVIKIDANTHEITQEDTYGGSGGDYFNSILPLPGGKLVLMGHSDSDDGDVGNNYGQRDVWLLALEGFSGSPGFTDPPLPFPEIKQPLSADTDVPTNILEVFPNPVKDRIHIRYALTEPSRVRMELTTITGKTVEYLLPAGQRGAGSHFHELSVQSLASGLYIFKLWLNDQLYVRKIVVP